MVELGRNFLLPGRPCARCCGDRDEVVCARAAPSPVETNGESSTPGLKNRLCHERFFIQKEAKAAEGCYPEDKSDELGQAPQRTGAGLAPAIKHLCKT